MPSAYTTGLSPTQIDDLVENTLHKFDRNEWIDISTGLQRYFAHETFLLGRRIAIDGGDQLQWQVKVRNTGAAINTGMYAKDNIKVADVTKHAIVGWTKQTTNMAYDIDERAFNSGDAVQILDYLKTRRHDAMTSFVELMESNMWGLPVDPNDEAESKKPFGIPYWIVRNATTGFNGGLPLYTAYTGGTVAGLSPTTYTNWKNWTGSYRAPDKRDLIKKMREANVKCDFRQPVAQPSPASSPPRFRIATTYEILSDLEEVLEAQNQNLGNDIASKDGDTMFRKVPVVWVPYLDNNQDTTGGVTDHPLGKNPIYGIDLNTFQCVFQRGKYMVRSRPLVASEQHSVRHVHWDSWTQFRCYNRRCNWVLTQAV